jgi:penicillin amidase
MRRRRILFIVLLIGLGVLGLYVRNFYQTLLESGRPLRGGELNLSGLSENVVLQTDDWGVPYLQAANMHDLIFAQGWAHANDRFAQMELNRRIVSGRLSEVIGEAGLEMDRTMMELQVRSIAEKSAKEVLPESLAIIQAYADGVNAWLDTRGEDLQPFFRLTGLQPEPWTVVDSLCVPALLAVNLSFVTKRAEEERYLVLRELGAEAVQDWIGEAVEIPQGILDLPYEPEWKSDPEIKVQPSPNGSDHSDLTNDIADPESARGSNNWAVAGNLTASGSALVANDPHLGLRLPSIWYQNHLSCPDLKAAGMSVPGAPGIVLGHNETLAWAFTNVMLDDNDLLLEMVSEDGKQVRRGEKWLDIQEQQNWIEVDGEDPVEFITYRTDLGPMLPADPKTGLPPRTLLWSAYHATDPITPFLDLAKANTLLQAMDAANHYEAPAQNIVLGHVDGTIAWTLFGRTPARNRKMGRLPSPAWDSSYAWNGLTESAASPRIAPGKQESIVTANCLVEGGGEGLQADYDTPFRRDRIFQLLQGHDPWTAESLSSPQTDVKNLYAIHLMESLASIGPDEAHNPRLAELEELAKHAWQELRDWDKQDLAIGHAALFWLFERALWDELFSDEIEKHHLAVPWTFLQRQKLLLVLGGNAKYDWIDNVQTPETETMHDVVQAALQQAWEQGVKKFGEDSSKWTFGEDLHFLTFPHHLEEVPVLGEKFTRGPYALSGSAATVCAFGGTSSNWKKVAWGPSMRAVWDTADWDQSRAIIPGGQGGHFADPHYDDQIELYLQGKTRIVPWSDRAIQSASVSTLTLKPIP